MIEIEVTNISAKSGLITAKNAGGEEMSFKVAGGGLPAGVQVGTRAYIPPLGDTPGGGKIVSSFDIIPNRAPATPNVEPLAAEARELARDAAAPVPISERGENR